MLNFPLFRAKKGFQYTACSYKIFRFLSPTQEEVIIWYPSHFRLSYPHFHSHYALYKRVTPYRNTPPQKKDFRPKEKWGHTQLLGIHQRRRNVEQAKTLEAIAISDSQIFFYLELVAYAPSFWHIPWMKLFYTEGLFFIKKLLKLFLFMYNRYLFLFLLFRKCMYEGVECTKLHFLVPITYMT